MARPRLLDLFCGAGGAAVGYYRAGFDVVGIDIARQPRYPFPFIQGDALKPPVRLEDFDAIHASPPCQKYSWAARRWREVERVDLLPATRELLTASGKPWVIENVIGAPLDNMLTLCGTQFGLDVLRHRRFESSFLLFGPGACSHNGTVRKGRYVTVAGHGGENAKGRGGRQHKQQAMGIDWMSDGELNEAIPPAYTAFLGRQLLSVVSEESVRRR